MNKIRGDFSSLAISGQCCSGKSTLCRILSKKLNWTHVDVGNEFRKIAKTKGIEMVKFGSIPENLLRQVDDQIRHRIHVEVNTIWDGRLTCYLARENMRIFKTYCVADLDVRAERCAGRDKMPLEEAKRTVLTRDIEEENVFKRLYGFSNPYKPEWVNLRLDTYNKSSKELARIVIRALRMPRLHIV